MHEQPDHPAGSLMHTQNAVPVRVHNDSSTPPPHSVEPPDVLLPPRPSEGPRFAPRAGEAGISTSQGAHNASIRS
eukprot:12722284-Alexandrium_andersonii.AAC.1